MPDAKNHGEAARRSWDEQDFCCDTESPPLEGRARAYTPDLAADHARVTQALRDVRHMLPPEGVAIVDEALAGMQFGDQALLFEPRVESAWIHPFN